MSSARDTLLAKTDTGPVSMCPCGPLNLAGKADPIPIITQLHDLEPQEGLLKKKKSISNYKHLTGRPRRLPGGGGNGLAEI